MKTCILTQCDAIQHCHLERDGFPELCPKLKYIKNEAIRKTELLWNNEHKLSKTVTMNRFKGTVKTVLDTFNLQDALQKIYNLRKDKEEKTFRKLVFMREHKKIPVEPEYFPEKWLPQSENNELIDEVTNIEDRSAVGVTKHPERMVQELQKAPKILTKKDKEYWKEFNARIRINEVQDIREQKIEKIMNNMEV